MAAPEDIAIVRHALELLLREIVDEPEKLAITPVGDDFGGVVFHVRIAQRDVGKIIGKGGRTAHAIRALLTAVAKKTKNGYRLDIQGDNLQREAPYEGVSSVEEPKKRK